MLAVVANDISINGIAYANDGISSQSLFYWQVINKAKLNVKVKLLDIKEYTISTHTSS